MEKKINELKEEVKDIWCKIESTINVLKDGKTIVAYERLLGVRDKLNRLLLVINSLEEK